MNTDAPALALIRSAKYLPDLLAQGPASVKGAKLYQGWCVPVGCRTVPPSSRSAEDPAGEAVTLSSEEPVGVVVVTECSDVDAGGRLQEELGDSVMKADTVGMTAAAAAKMMSGSRRLWSGIFGMICTAEQVGRQEEEGEMKWATKLKKLLGGVRSACGVFADEQEINVGGNLIK